MERVRKAFKSLSSYLYYSTYNLFWWHYLFAYLSLPLFCKFSWNKTSLSFLYHHQCLAVHHSHGRHSGTFFWINEHINDKKKIYGISKWKQNSLFRDRFWGTFWRLQSQEYLRVMMAKLTYIWVNKNWSTAGSFTKWLSGFSSSNWILQI